jgi:predicted nuclease of predicted toxin-antitoxin system
VTYAAEVFPGEPDEVLLARAYSEKRILLTDDKDFGELVFYRRLASQGILLMRLSSPRIEVRLRRLAEVWGAIESQLEERFVVLGDKKVRIRPIRLTP